MKQKSAYNGKHVFKTQLSVIYTKRCNSSKTLINVNYLVFNLKLIKDWIEFVFQLSQGKILVL